MAEIIEQQFREICPTAAKNADVFIGYLNKTFAKYAIDTPLRMAMFVAQLAHESEAFHYTREIWGPTAQQKRYERDFKSAWPPTAQDNTNKLAYSLGNDMAGEGSKFRGRGLIMITGKTNYTRISKDLFGDNTLVVNPQLLETPQYATISAGWFWDKHNLNLVADTDDLEHCTKVINGGLNGIESRKAYYERAKVALGVVATS